MKNINTLILIALVSSFFSCTKTLDSNIILAKSDSVITNEEINRITEVYTDRDLEININYHDNVVPYLRGNTAGENFDFIMGNETFSTQNGQIDVESTIFESYIGKRNEFTIRNADREETYAVYIPNRLNVYEGVESFGQIQRTNSKIKWEADAENIAGVLVNYSLLDNTYGSNPNTLGGGSFIIEDDGEFNLDALLQDTKVKSINITLSRGNAVSYVYKGHKLAFYFVSSDSNMYVEVMN